MFSPALRDLRLLPLVVFLSLFATAAASAHEGHHRHAAVAHEETARLVDDGRIVAESRTSLRDSSCPGNEGGTCCCTDPVVHVPWSQPALAPPPRSALAPLPPHARSISPPAADVLPAIDRLLVLAAPRAPPALLQ